jgi:hypothetical protein
VVFRLAASSSGSVRVFDLGGRLVDEVPLVSDGDGAIGRWSARDRSGVPLPSGLYFARAGAHVSRIAVIAR